MPKFPPRTQETEGAQLPLPQQGTPAADTAQAAPGRIGPVGKEEVAKAEAILQKYKSGKDSLNNRIVENEKWFTLRQWEVICGVKSNPDDPEPASAWLFNCIANKHADAMDNLPEPCVLPREKGDVNDADVLSDVLPVILEQNRFEDAYSTVWWRKLKSGSGVYGVFWDAMKNNGLGEIDIRACDVLNLYWESGISDIQHSPHLFHVGIENREMLIGQYPFMADKVGQYPTLETPKYVYEDNADTSDKVVVVDWYYKVRNEAGKTILHYCKFCCGEVLYASENDPAYAQRGYYDHGKYPFVMDILFPLENTPAGFGYIDVGKSPQIYIDKLDQAILRHSVIGSRQRYWIRGDGNINIEEFRDSTCDFVHFYGSGDPRDCVISMDCPPLSDIYVGVRENKIDELKETSGNRDFSQGGTSSGVTAASAIAALQEAGSKLSRDMIKSAYRACVEVDYLVLELTRQFYKYPRFFRIIGNEGAMRFVEFSGDQIAGKPQGNDFGIDLGYRVPIFDIKVSAQKASPFATAAQNERAKEFYGMGFFRPDLADQALAALDMMQFEGIEEVRERIAQNQTLYQQVQQLSQLALAMAQELDAIKGSAYSQQIMQLVGMNAQQTPQGNAARTEMQPNILGSINAGMSSTAGAARTRAAENATPKA